MLLDVDKVAAVSMISISAAIMSLCSAAMGNNDVGLRNNYGIENSLVLSP